MYKIFVNQNVLFLTDDHMWRINQNEYPNDEAANVFFLTAELSVTELIREWLKDGKEATYIFVYDNLPDLERFFMNRFKIVGAAGGVVINEKDELLLIFRNGKWDLPKGKMDGGETPEQAAIREVREETGLKKLDISKEITFPGIEQNYMMHVYKEKTDLILKKTTWFEMKSGSEESLTPQKEEGITDLKWVKFHDLPDVSENTYCSLLDVFHQFHSSQKL